MGDETINWEWSGGRSPTATVRARVLEVKPERKGWFGIGNSPSMADALPDPVVLRFEVLSSTDEKLKLAGYALRLPKLELGGAAIGDTVDISLIGDRVAVGVKRVSVP